VAIPQHFLQELLARADIVEIVGRYVPLKKTGANFSGLCPFHGEKTPSFTVSPSKQFYHCFGCGKNGNAIGFLMDHTGAGFVETVHELAQQYGLQVPEDERSPAERARAAEQTEQRASLTDVLARAADAWRKQLKASPRAIDYLKRRGLSGQVARQFGLGYAPEGWRGLASVFPDYADPLLVESGLVIVSEDDEGKRYDRFRDRIMFPIRSVKGEVIGFGGRVLGDDKPKYLNSPETPVFHKGRELYGLFEARTALREQGYALVVEGYMDVVALAQQGLGNAVATLGTACTPEHVHKLFRFTDHIVFSFDGDAAGRRAAHKALEAALPLATDTRSVKFLFLPPEHDPDSFVRAEGVEAFARRCVTPCRCRASCWTPRPRTATCRPPKAARASRPEPGHCGSCCPRGRWRHSCWATSPRRCRSARTSWSNYGACVERPRHALKTIAIRAHPIRQESQKHPQEPWPSATRRGAHPRRASAVPCRSC